MKKMLLGIIEIKIIILPVAQQKHTNRKIIHSSTEMEVTSKLIKCHVITMNDEVERDEELEMSSEWQSINDKFSSELKATAVNQYYVSIRLKLHFIVNGEKRNLWGENSNEKSFCWGKKLMKTFCGIETKVNI